MNGSPNRLAALVLDGVQGPLTVNGVVYKGVMPAWKTVLSEDEMAAVLTYIRQSWRNAAAPVSAATVSGVRAHTGERNGFWTERDLIRTF